MEDQDDVHCQHHSCDNECYEFGCDGDDESDCVHCECCCTCQACEYADRTDSTVYPAGPYALVDAEVMTIPGPQVPELGDIGGFIAVRFGGGGDE